MTYQISTDGRWPVMGTFARKAKTAALVASVALGALCGATAQSATPSASQLLLQKAQVAQRVQPAVVGSTPVNSATVAAAVAGAQLWLYNKYDSANQYWAADASGNGNPLTNTAATVAALIETGKYSDPLYKAKIDAGVAYIKTKVWASGAISDSDGTSDGMYETGMALVALTLHGQANADTMSAADKLALQTIVRNAMNYLKSMQNIEGSTRNGDFTAVGGTTTTNLTGDCTSYAASYGGFSYAYNTRYSVCGNGADSSNSQFAVMGLWYGSRYLGDPIDTADWAKAALKWVKSVQQANGGFSYQPTYSGYQLGGTASNLWILAMIGKADAVNDTNTAIPDAMKTKTMVVNAINYFASPANYTWNYSAYMYFIYGMSKALTGTVGPAAVISATVGTETFTRSWALDMENELLNGSYYQTAVQTVAGGTATATVSYWDGYSSLDAGATGKTAWALLSLAFGSVSTESTEKLLAQDPVLEPPLVTGLVTLHTSGGVTISSAGRGNASAAKLGKNVVLPIGSMNFTLNNVKVGGTTMLTITPPAGSLVPGGTNSFVTSDGKIKPGLTWYKISGGNWNDSRAPISINTATGVITVILTDGGAGDEDGVANGKIVDPGAPGFGGDAAAAAAADDSWFGCSVGAGEPDPTLIVLMLGSIAYLARRRRR